MFPSLKTAHVRTCTHAQTSFLLSFPIFQKLLDYNPQLRVHIFQQKLEAFLCDLMSPAIVGASVVGPLFDQFSILQQFHYA